MMTPVSCCFSEEALLFRTNTKTVQILTSLSKALFLICRAKQHYFSLVMPLCACGKGFEREGVEVWVGECERIPLCCVEYAKLFLLRHGFSRDIIISFICLIN
jgi:hypothetical protein